MVNGHRDYKGSESVGAFAYEKSRKPLETGDLASFGLTTSTRGIFGALYKSEQLTLVLKLVAAHQ